MHKRVACPHCEGKGFVPDVRVMLHPFFHVDVVGKKTCPNCKGHQYYLSPVTNRDIAEVASDDQVVQAFAQVATNSFVESLSKVYGASLNQHQVDCIRNDVTESLVKFLKSNVELSGSPWGDLANIDLSEFTLSTKDFLTICGRKGCD